MEIILTQDVSPLGKAGQKVTVKDGYARNFLFPKGLALSATAGVRTQMEALRAAQIRQSEMQEARAQELASRVGKVSCTIQVPVGEQGKLHGAVTSGDILNALKGQGLVLEKHQIILDSPIHSLGEFEVPIRLHPRVSVSIKLSVVRK